MTYPIPNVNGYTVEVWEWIHNFIPHFIMDVITYPCCDQSLTILIRGALVSLSIYVLRPYSSVALWRHTASGIWVNIGSIFGSCFHYLNQCWFIVDWVIMENASVQFELRYNTLRSRRRVWKCLLNGSHSVHAQYLSMFNTEKHGHLRKQHWSLVVSIRGCALVSRNFNTKRVKVHSQHILFWVLT